MSKITTHILDVAHGHPAAGVEIRLYAQTADSWQELNRAKTNADGRAGHWTAPPGIYKLRFETGSYYKRIEAHTFYPFVEVHFEIATAEHYHVPLLLSPWGYSTYRGS